MTLTLARPLLAASLPALAVLVLWPAEWLPVLAAFGLLVGGGLIARAGRGSTQRVLVAWLLALQVRLVGSVLLALVLVDADAVSAMAITLASGILLDAALMARSLTPAPQEGTLS